MLIGEAPIALFIRRRRLKQSLSLVVADRLHVTAGGPLVLARAAGAWELGTAPEPIIRALSPSPRYWPTWALRSCCIGSAVATLNVRLVWICSLVVVPGRCWQSEEQQRSFAKPASTCRAASHPELVGSPGAD